MHPQLEIWVLTTTAWLLGPFFKFTLELALHILFSIDAASLYIPEWILNAEVLSESRKSSCTAHLKGFRMHNLQSSTLQHSVNYMIPFFASLGVLEYVWGYSETYRSHEQQPGNTKLADWGNLLRNSFWYFVLVQFVSRRTQLDAIRYNTWKLRATALSTPPLLVYIYVRPRGKVRICAFA